MSDYENLGVRYLFPIGLWRFVWPSAPNEEMVKWIYDNVSTDGVVIDQQSVFSETYGREQDNSAAGGWQSGPIATLEEFNPILKFIQFIGKEIAETVGIEQLGMEIGMWANLNRQYAYNTIHSHPGCHFSGVYYAKVPKGDCGDLVIYNPDFWTSVWLPPDGDMVGNIKTPDGQKYNCKAEENVCYAFRSNQLHEVSRNNTEEDRISFAFNIKYMLP